MGATPWHYEVPWQANPADALRAFQAQFFAEHHNFEGELARCREGAEQAARLQRENGDCYGILELFEAELAMIESAQSKGLPTEPQEQLALLRAVLEGFGNILDVLDVSEEGGHHIARRMPAAEVQSLVGTERPNSDQANAALSAIFDTLGRAESVCLPVFDREGVAVIWLFVGKTFD